MQGRRRKINIDYTKTYNMTAVLEETPRRESSKHICEAVKSSEQAVKQPGKHQQGHMTLDSRRTQGFY